MVESLSISVSESIGAFENLYLLKNFLTNFLQIRQWDSMWHHQGRAHQLAECLISVFSKNAFARNFAGQILKARSCLFPFPFTIRSKCPRSKEASNALVVWQGIYHKAFLSDKSGLHSINTMLPFLSFLQLSLCASCCPPWFSSFSGVSHNPFLHRKYIESTSLASYNLIFDKTAGDY